MNASNLNAVLVRLSISQFSNSRTDESISKEVRALHSLAGNAGKWVKSKLPDYRVTPSGEIIPPLTEAQIQAGQTYPKDSILCEPLRPIGKHAADSRGAHYELTLPWEDGLRILPLSMRPKYVEKVVGTCGAKFDALVNEFIPLYPRHLAAAKMAHAGKFNEDDYPIFSRVKDEFSFRVEYSPVPQSNHFEGIVNGATLAEMQSTLTTANAAKVEEAVRDLWSRLLAPVQAMATKLSDPEGTFRDSLVGNVKEIVEMVPDLNLVGDNQIKAALQEIESRLAGLDPDTLRHSVQVRKFAAASATELVQKFGAMGKRKLSVN